MATTGLQLLSLVKPDGELEVSLANVPVPDPGPDEVVVRIEAAPINPSDLGLLIGPADVATARRGGTAEAPTLVARVPERILPALATRLGKPLPVGNEGAGTVIAAGSSPAAQALKGKLVAAWGGAMYAQYRCIHADMCLELPAGARAEDGASAFINPLTALYFLETVKREGQRALVNTAGASNLGQMLVRLCARDGIELVSIVRSAEQAAVLKQLGATHVLDSSASGFAGDLVDAMAETKALIAFDAIGGGKLGGQILGAMEQAVNRGVTVYNRYGSSTVKQLFIYGALDMAPTEIARTFGLAWSVSGWLLSHWMVKLGMDKANELKRRVASELTTTFASTYSRRVTLREVIEVDVMKAYKQMATGEKYLITPNA